MKPSGYAKYAVKSPGNSNDVSVTPVSCPLAAGVRVLFQVAVVLVRRAFGRQDQRDECEGQIETLERLRGIKAQVPQEDDSFIEEVRQPSPNSSATHGLHGNHIIPTQASDNNQLSYLC